MEAVVGQPSERMDIDAAAAASVPIPPPPDAFVAAWNHPLFLGYLRNHPNNPNPGVIPQVQAPPWVAASENRQAQVDCGVADRTAPVAAAASVPPPPPEARRPIADWLAAHPEEEVFTPAVLRTRRISHEEAEENIRESSRLSQLRRRRAREVNLQLETVPPRQEPSANEILTAIGKGEKKSSDFVPLNQHPDMQSCLRLFQANVERFQTDCFFHCQYCKEKGPLTKRARDGLAGECVSCQKQRRDRKIGCHKFSAANNMDPFPQGYPHHLPKVTPIEETMIARVHIAMKCYQMQGTGHMRYEGNVINLEKETIFLSVLTAAFNEIPTVFVVRVNNPNAPTNVPNHRDEEKFSACGCSI